MPPPPCPWGVFVRRIRPVFTRNPFWMVVPLLAWAAAAALGQAPALPLPQVPMPVQAGPAGYGAAAAPQMPAQYPGVQAVPLPPPTPVPAGTYAPPPGSYVPPPPGS